MKKRKRLQSNWQHNERGESKEDIQVESLKRKRSEPVTPNAKEQKENKTMNVTERKEPDGGAGRSNDVTGTNDTRNKNQPWMG